MTPPREGRSRMLLAFDVLGRWSNARYDARRARGSVKRSSIGVDVDTLKRLNALAVDVSQLAPGEWGYRTPSLAELLDWLSRGVAIRPDVELTHACKMAIDEMHARRDLDMHVNGDVG